MAQPRWITPAGNLGVIPEGIFFQMPLLAEDPDHPNDPAAVKFRVIAGSLPAGMQCSPSGVIVGTPKAVANLAGTPEEVSRDVTNKFAARVYTTKIVNGVEVVDRLADRTFTITVTGQDAPEFITPAGNVGTFFDGTQVTGNNSIQIEYTDTDPDDRVIIRLISGQLPPGLTLSATGLISGFIAPLTTSGATAGYSRDGQGYDQYAYDFTTQSTNFNYEFVLEVTDGKSSDIRNYSIQVYSRNGLTADNTQITADNTFITADGTPVRTPILLTPTGSLGTIRSDNFWAFKFDGIDFDGDPIEYVITLGPGIGFDAATIPFTLGSYDNGGFDRSLFDLPPGLVLDPNTGWLYGYIPDLGLTENDYQFAIQVRKTNDPDVISPYYYFTLTIVGDVDTEIKWISPSFLGNITTGSISLFNIEAVSVAGIPLQYRIKSGSASSLPQGLSLLPSGNISGRVSFNCFVLDGNTTTFDVKFSDVDPDALVSQTTFDRRFNFTVEAYSSGGYINTSRRFTIQIDKVFDKPYENLYIEAMPPENDRVLVDSLLQNISIIPTASLFRPDDPYFGKATNITYWHAYGLTAATIADYVSSLYENHYWKNLVLGSIETAQALDDEGNVIYEVVYSRIVDDLVNEQGNSVGKEVVLPYTVISDDMTETSTVYPNSLVDMREQVIDTVGQVSNLLPRWMLSKQPNGRILGFTPAWVIAYVKPGQSARIKYNIQQQFGVQLNQIDFKVDRYELDRSMTYNWDPITQKWIPQPPAATTFDSTSTIFDGNGTRFISPVNNSSTETTAFDKYLVFPYRTILG